MAPAKKRLVVAPGNVLYLDGEAFAEGQEVELDDHEARRYLEEGAVQDEGTSEAVVAA